MSDSITVGVVAHVSRWQAACSLSRMLDDADHMSIDNGSLGCDDNHRSVWEMCEQSDDSDWFVVLEDDALPTCVVGTRLLFGHVLSYAPTDFVSLYLGRLRPVEFQPMIRSAVLRAVECDASWITSDRLYHAVAVAVRMKWVPGLIEWMNSDAMQGVPIDEMISAYASIHEQRISYTWPSLVEHADTETLVAHRDNCPRVPGRVAWCADQRESDWNAVEVRVD